MQHTPRPRRVSLVVEAIHEARFETFEGCPALSAQKALYGSRTDRRELLNRIKENNILADKSIMLYKKQTEKIVLVTVPG